MLKMRKMKDSSIEWIGEIPEGWEIRKIKNNFMIYAGATPKSEKAEYWDGIIPWITPADFKTADKYASCGRKSLTALGYDSCGTTLVPAGSIIFSKRAPVGSVVIAKNALCTNQGCLSCIPNEAVNSTYFYYCMSILTEQFELVSAGTTFKEIAASTFASFLLPCPPLSQQNEIVNFLDKEISHVDSMLSQTRSSIEEYKKLKQAVITQAVTKGVRGEREMKDSGVEWIGEIPAAWDVAKAKYCVTITHGSDPKTEGSIPVYGSGAESFKTCGEYKEGPTVLIGRKGATLHIPHYIEGKYWNVDTAFDVKAKNNFSLPYYYYLATSFDYKFYIAQTTLPGMTQSNYYNMFLPFPTFPEQEEIVNYLDAKCAEIDKLIAKKEQLVKELESYKRSLIYEVVTGKREV